jgi:5-methylcytosine-specific restriction endonuclease McrA
MRGYRAANPEKHLAKEREYREKNREVLTNRVRDWQRNNPDRVKVRNDRWRKANMDMARAHVLRYRTRLAQAAGTITIDDIERMLETQGYQCAAPHCRRDILQCFSVDHIVPLSRGGSSLPDNLQLLCRSCNPSKGAQTMEEWLSHRG